METFPRVRDENKKYLSCHHLAMLFHHPPKKNTGWNLKPTWARLRSTEPCSSRSMLFSTWASQTSYIYPSMKLTGGPLKRWLGSRGPLFSGAMYGELLVSGRTKTSNIPSVLARSTFTWWFHLFFFHILSVGICFCQTSSAAWWLQLENMFLKLNPFFPTSEKHVIKMFETTTQI